MDARRIPKVASLLVATVLFCGGSSSRAGESSDLVTDIANGDVDGSGRIDVTDVIYLARYLFLNGRAPVWPSCLEGNDEWPFLANLPVSRNGDINGDMAVDTTDIVRLVSYLFDGGDAPVEIRCEPLQCLFDCSL